MRELPPLSAASRAATIVAVTYTAIVTSDAKVGPIPVKALLLAGCLALWLAARRPWREPRASWAFAVPVLVVGAAVPVIWFAVALVAHHAHDPAQRAGLRYAVTEASHFGYVLLFFPLVDELRAGAPADDARPPRIGTRGDPNRVWLWPTFVTCALTVGLWLAWAIGGYDYGTHHVFALNGVIGVEASGDYRVSLVTQILILPAVAMIMTAVEAGRGRRGQALMLALVLAATYFSHTRGYWLGLIVVAGTLVALTSAWPRCRTLRLALLAAGLLALVVSQVLVATHGAAVRGGSELSTAQRYQEAQQLIRATGAHPVLGAGLGATLPSGYVRSATDPWSFELTYLQLLFELGVVGLLAVLALPGWILWRCGRRLTSLRGARLLDARVAIAGTLGLIFTDATNPDLVNSVGMLALAVVAASAESALFHHAAEEDPGEPPEPLLVTAPPPVRQAG